MYAAAHATSSTSRTATPGAPRRPRAGSTTRSSWAARIGGSHAELLVSTAAAKHAHSDDAAQPASAAAPPPPPSPAATAWSARRRARDRAGARRPPCRRPPRRAPGARRAGWRAARRAGRRAAPRHARAEHRDARAGDGVQRGVDGVEGRRLRRPLLPPRVRAEAEHRERAVRLVRVGFAQALAPEVVHPHVGERRAVLHVGVVDDRQPVVEDEAADDGVEVAGESDARRERGDRGVGPQHWRCATTPTRPRACLEIDVQV